MSEKILDVLSGLLLFVGTFFMFVAALGLHRLPDIFMRMSASTKGATLGSGSLLLAAAIYFREFDVAARAIATIVFLLLTAPIAAHMLGRAAYRVVTDPLWRGSVADDLRGAYDQAPVRVEDRLSAGPPASPPSLEEGP